jgi:hypothetical protein
MGVWQAHIRGLCVFLGAFSDLEHHGTSGQLSIFDPRICESGHMYHISLLVELILDLSTSTVHIYHLGCPVWPFLGSLGSFGANNPPVRARF